MTAIASMVRILPFYGRLRPAAMQVSGVIVLLVGLTGDAGQKTGRKKTFPQEGFFEERTGRGDARSLSCLIRVKHPLNILGVIGFTERQHQQDARFLRIQGIGDDEVEFIVIGFAIARDDALADAARTDD